MHVVSDFPWITWQLLHGMPDFLCIGPQWMHRIWEFPWISRQWMRGISDFPSIMSALIQRIWEFRSITKQLIHGLESSHESSHGRCMGFRISGHSLMHKKPACGTTHASYAGFEKNQSSAWLQQS